MALGNNRKKPLRHTKKEPLKERDTNVLPVYKGQEKVEYDDIEDWETPALHEHVDKMAITAKIGKKLGYRRTRRPLAQANKPYQVMFCDIKEFDGPVKGGYKFRTDSCNHK